MRKNVDAKINELQQKIWDLLKDEPPEQSLAAVSMVTSSMIAIAAKLYTDTGKNDSELIELLINTIKVSAHSLRLNMHTFNSEPILCPGSDMKN